MINNIIKKFRDLKVTNTIISINFIISVALFRISEVLIPLSISNIIKQLTNNNTNGFYISCVLLLISYIYYNLMYAYRYKYYIKSNNMVFRNIQNKIYNKIISSDYKFKDKITKEELINTTNVDVRTLSFMESQIYQIYSYLFKLIILFIIIFKVNIYIGIIVFLIDLLYIFLMDKNNERIVKYLNGHKIYGDKISKNFLEISLGIREIKNYNIADKVKKPFDKSIDSYEKAYFNKMKYVVRKYTVIPYTIKITKVLLYLLLGILVLNNDMKLHILILIISYYDSIMTDTDNLVGEINSIREESVSLDRVLKILNYKSIEYNNKLLEINSKEIFFNNVYYKNILEDLSFTIKPNMINIISGESGAGKTTIFKLLERLDKPSKGNIYIGNNNLYDISNKSYTDNITIVDQDPFLFNMSIKDNIEIVGKIDNLEDKMKELGLDIDLNTIIINNGENLSGGQKQIISFLRALAHNKDIMILDEITSSLDNVKTNEIIKYLVKLKENKTIILISHKKEILKKADNIIYIKDGKLEKDISII